MPLFIWKISKIFGKVILYTKYLWLKSDFSYSIVIELDINFKGLDRRVSCLEFVTSNFINKQLYKNWLTLAIKLARQLMFRTKVWSSSHPSPQWSHTHPLPWTLVFYVPWSNWMQPHQGIALPCLILHTAVKGYHFVSHISGVSN